MAILGSFDFSPGKPVVKTTLSGTIALDDTFEIKNTYPVAFTNLAVTNGSLVFSSYSYAENTISTVTLPNFGATNFVELANRSGSSNALYNSSFRIVNNLDNSKSTEALFIVGTDGAETIIAPATTASIIYGGAGNDTITGGSSVNTIYGGPGSNTLSGDAGDDAYRAFTQDKATDIIIDTAGTNDSVSVLLPSLMGENYNWWFKRVGNDLTGKIYDSMGGFYSFTVKNQYSFTGGIESFFAYAMGSPNTLAVRGGNFDIQSTTSSIYLYAGTDSDELIRITGLGPEKTGVRVWGNAGADDLIRNENLNWVSFIGGDGIDTIEYFGKRSDYTITATTSPFTKDVVNTVLKNSALDKTITDYVMAERLVFADTALAMDINGNAGSVAKVLATVFGKDALSNKTYAGIGLQLMDSGMSYLALADLAVNLGKPTNSQIVDTLWKNLYGTAPSDITKSSLVSLLDTKAMTAGSLAFVACELNPNIDLVGLATTGLAFIQQG